MSSSWAKTSACRLQISMSCVVLQYRVAPVLSRSTVHRLAGLRCRLFLAYGLQLVTHEEHRSSLRRLTCPAQDHFIDSIWRRNSSSHNVYNALWVVGTIQRLNAYNTLRWIFSLLFAFDIIRSGIFPCELLLASFPVHAYRFTVDGLSGTRKL